MNITPQLVRRMLKYCSNCGKDRTVLAGTPYCETCGAYQADRRGLAALVLSDEEMEEYNFEKLHDMCKPEYSSGKHFLWLLNRRSFSTSKLRWVFCPMCGEKLDN